MAEEKLRVHFGDLLGKAEVVIYSILAALLFITALATIANAGKMLWEGLGHWTIAAIIVAGRRRSVSARPR